MKILSAFVSLFLSLHTLAAGAPELSPFTGTYQGQVLNGGDLDPVITTFEFNPLGRFTGHYRIDEDGQWQEGVLSNVRLEDSHTLSLEWTDRDGEGYVRFSFSEDYSRFSGYWGNRLSEDVHPWDGKK